MRVLVWVLITIWSLARLWSARELLRTSRAVGLALSLVAP